MNWVVARSSTLAPPLAGSMRMGIGQFLRLDFVGACLYTLAYTGFGYLFSGVIEAITRGVRTVGHAVEWLLLVALIGYVGYRT